MRRTPAAVLDATAVVAWVRGERGADVIERALLRSAISAVNLAEVFYKVKEAEPRADIELLGADLGAMGLEVVAFTEDHALEIPRIRAAASSLKEGQPDVSGSLSFADCACIATALVLGVPVVTDDGFWGALDLGRSFRALAFR